jgi:hypothetical protein
MLFLLIQEYMLALAQTKKELTMRWIGTTEKAGVGQELEQNQQ